MQTISSFIKMVGKKIGTHSGVFHCDEAMACYLLKLLPEYSDAQIVRSRDEKILSECDIVVDVGGVYDPDRKRFDHHQKDFTHTFGLLHPDLGKTRSIKLSSAGLVYAHFGRDIISVVLKARNTELPPDQLTMAFFRLYDGLIEELDAIDNGVPMVGDATPKYKISTDLSSRVSHLNPAWNRQQVTDKDKDELFVEAMQLAGSQFLEKLHFVVDVWLPARQVVLKALGNRSAVHDSGQIMDMDCFVPWQEHFFELEEEMGIKDCVKYALFRDTSGSYRVRAVPINSDSFVCRKFLPESWRGLRADDLSAASGVPGCIFCHTTGFIGGNETREGALEMAKKSLML